MVATVTRAHAAHARDAWLNVRARGGRGDGSRDVQVERPDDALTWGTKSYEVLSALCATLPHAQALPFTKRLQGRAAFKNMKASRSRPYIRTVTGRAQWARVSVCFVRATAQFHLMIATIEV